jgi:hypothetical protein
MPEFVFKPEIDVGNLLTLISVLVAAAALLNTWRRDRTERRRKDATDVRAGVAKTLAKLERWREIYLWFFRSIDPVLVETSQLLAKRRDPASARDYLWRKVGLARAEAEERVLDEEVEIAYVELSGRAPQIYWVFVQVDNDLRRAWAASVEQLFLMTQQVTLDFEPSPSGTYRPAALGNELRGVTGNISAEFAKRADDILRNARTFLLAAMQATDDELLDPTFWKSGRGIPVLPDRPPAPREPAGIALLREQDVEDSRGDSEADSERGVPL